MTVLTKRWPFILLLLVIVLVMSNCTMLGLNRASLTVADKPAASPKIESLDYVDPQKRQAIKQAFENSLYGIIPDVLSVEVVDTRSILSERVEGLGTLEEIDIEIDFGSLKRSIKVVLAVPTAMKNNTPLIISQTFSDNCFVFPDADVTPPEGETDCETGFLGGVAMNVAESIFGEFIAEVPLEQYLEAGIAYASFHGPGLLPDSKADAPDILSQFSDGVRPGTLAIWAAGYAAVARAVDSDPRFDTNAKIALGHSRYGKAALIAGAWFEDIDAVIAHQSGFAGAALSRSETGEGLARMSRAYPHWLSPSVQQYSDDLPSLPVDQHQLIALNAPKPLLIGNGRRDVWSDPNSTFRSVLAAAPTYEAISGEGVDSEVLTETNLSSKLVYYLRPGGHAVIQQDVSTFIAFVENHFGA